MRFEEDAPPRFLLGLFSGALWPAADFKDAPTARYIELVTEPTRLLGKLLRLLLEVG
jgi:hypothetical protein